MNNNRELYYYAPLEKVNSLYWGVAIAPCDNSKFLELPVGITLGQRAQCPLCGKFHLVLDVNNSAELAD